MSQSLGDEDESSHISVRFQYAQDVNGHYVVLGREGTLQRCEDEPIRTPGAIQGFGVLIAVEEQGDMLVVRQVSENATELLGLSPRYLFSLSCLTDILPASQADILWENIDFLSRPERSESSDDDADNPQVFLLSGMSEPGRLFPSTSGQVPVNAAHWTCWCAIHMTPIKPDHATPHLIVLEFELETDILNPLYPHPGSPANTPHQVDVRDYFQSQPSCTRVPHNQPQGPESQTTHPPPHWSPSHTNTSFMPHSSYGCTPNMEDILESTTNQAKPLSVLERMRQPNRVGDRSGAGSPRSRSRRYRPSSGVDNGIGVMQVFALMTQINEQLGATQDLDSFLKVVVGIIKDLTQFHRVLIYQFDESWNGQVVGELVDWNKTHDLYRGLHFPAGDIPAQARALYAANKVRILYNRTLPTARIVARNKDDLDTPLDMTHCYLRAMSPIHLEYLGNMGVRASMSISIMAFGALWGLVACHSYGPYGMRVSFPLRQMLRLVSQSISRNIERLSYAQRLHTRKLINTAVSDRHPTGYIVSNADDLLALFDADFGILVVGEGAKILGPNQNGQEILFLAEYLRVKKFGAVQVSQAVTEDFPDLQLSSGLDVLAGLLYVPLSSGGKDFIAFLRRGQAREVHWAGMPYKEPSTQLEPRKSFKIWSETVAGRCRAWTDEQLETAGVLALVYGKFIEVWRQKETATQTAKLTTLLISNASHEVRTPLNHIINYLELALNGPLDVETRDNLTKSHTASKSLLFTINDLLDLTRLDSGHSMSSDEPFDIQALLRDAIHLYDKEASRRGINFELDLTESPLVVVGDASKIRTVVQNLTANALKYTKTGSITIRCSKFPEPEGLRGPQQIAVEISVSDTGCGIPQTKLEQIFREFEHAETVQATSKAKPKSEDGVGKCLGLAIVARNVEQLGGQLRVHSKLDSGSRFSFLIPLSLPPASPADSTQTISDKSPNPSPRVRSRRNSDSSARSEIEQLVEALSSNHMASSQSPIRPESTTENKLLGRGAQPEPPQKSAPGTIDVANSQTPLRPVRVDGTELSTTLSRSIAKISLQPRRHLRILIVEDNDVNRMVLEKRLRLNGHTVVTSTNGQEGLDTMVSDRTFDVVLMDIQMPILDGFKATQQIREVERDVPIPPDLEGQTPQKPNPRIPIFAVSASLKERQRQELLDYGMDGWVLKPIDFKRLNEILRGVTDPLDRRRLQYKPDCNWEKGGWLT
ncbi:hypothetical protein BDN72DRAFT_766552 [Pluteus cervinus]|uniref:Uncharacterized protein n=1 Tax=Pluteus cervinus TaxID=181527 RepID=A0ACD3AXS0_9AGAR|nr:hypothetical protein BDN72DRAFT_766552 [Pluteus cervinus]